MAMMDYPRVDVTGIPSPAILVFKPLLEHNLGEMLAIAGSPDRLRPALQDTQDPRDRQAVPAARGDSATSAPPRARRRCASRPAPAISSWPTSLWARWWSSSHNWRPRTECAARVPGGLRDGGRVALTAATAAGVIVGAMVDLDTGLHRTGLPVGEEAMRLYRRVTRSPGLRPAGLHVYDAQNNRNPDLADRTAAVERTIAPVLEMAEALRREGHAVPELLCGGTGTFPVYARYGGSITCSPGTAVFWDAGYSNAFPDLDARLAQAALMLGRVVSRPTPQHITLDLGTKGIASDPPIGKRGVILGLEDAVTTVHNEEHWVVTSERAGAYHVGDSVYVVPTHICPNTNLYPLLYIVDDQGTVSERWEVVARHRPLVL